MSGKTDQIKGRIKKAAVALLPLCAVVLVAVACTGPAGPAGPTGMTGMTGGAGLHRNDRRAGLGWGNGRTGPGRNHRGPGSAGVVAAAGASLDVGEGVHVRL